MSSVSESAGTRLLNGQYLACNEYIVSPHGAFFAIMQGDGNFCVYAGTGPADNRGLLWMSGKYGSAADYVALIQSDGNFVTRRGTFQNSRWEDNYWSANVVRSGEEFQLLLQNDGRLVLASTHHEPDPKHIMWMSDQAQSPGANYAPDAQVLPVAYANGPGWRTFVPTVSGVIGAVDLWMEAMQPHASQQFTMRLYAGTGIGGEPLGEQTVTATTQPGVLNPSRIEAPFEPPVSLASSGNVRRPPGEIHLVAGKPYTLELIIGTRVAPLQPGPFLGLGPRSGQFDGAPLAYRIYMRPDRPKWSHPVG